MRRFQLRRLEDVTGVSGPGVIAEGVEFTRGRVVLDWRTATPGTTIFDSIADMLAVHGHAGRTVVDWIDEEHPGVVIPAKLGWSNADTGPEEMRLYALDAGQSPRWAQPHARTVETAIRDTDCWHEGARAVVIVTPRPGGAAVSERVGCESCVCDPDRPGCVDLVELCGATVIHVGRVVGCDLPPGHQPGGTHQESGGVTWTAGGVL